MDVYDALRARRPYKTPFSHEKSKNIILDGSGKHFDPQLVDSFARIDDEFDVIHTSMIDEA